MEWKLPGTELSINPQEADSISSLFESMFLPGGMVLSQVASITGLEPYTVQNWVKRGLLSSPVGKRYTMRQLCRIININTFKSILPMERICGLLTYINGQLDNDADDIIDDSELYFLFVKLAARVRLRDDEKVLTAAMNHALEGYREPVPGARRRVENTLKVMLTAWMAAQLRQKAEEKLTEMEETIQVH